MTELDRDYPRLIREAQAGHGLVKKKKLTDYKLGLMLGVDKKTIRRWKDGKSKPNEEQAILLRYWHGVFHRETRDSVPTKSSNPEKVSA